jgi:hypothetical protein
VAAHKAGRNNRIVSAPPVVRSGEATIAGKNRSSAGRPWC